MEFDIWHKHREQHPNSKFLNESFQKINRIVKLTGTNEPTRFHRFKVNGIGFDIPSDIVVFVSKLGGVVIRFDSDI